MAFTYDPALGDPISQIRFLIQDTRTLRAIFQDEEIQASLYGDGSTPSQRYQTAVLLTRRQMTRYAQDADYKLQSEELKASQRYKQLQTLLDSLLQEQAIASGVVAVPTSTTSSAKIFDVGQMDYNYTGDVDTDN